jgi:hypothetical protein
MQDDGKPTLGLEPATRSLRAQRLRIALLSAVAVAVVAAVAMVWPAPADAAQTCSGFLDCVTHPSAGQGHVFDVKDTAGRRMDAADVIATGDATYPYLACYHEQGKNPDGTRNDRLDQVLVATSSNLTTWTQRGELARHGTQCAIARYGGSYFVLYEENEQCLEGPTKRCSRLRIFTSLSNLLGAHCGLAQCGAWIDRVLQHLTVTGCEGTPSFLRPPTFALVDIGFHYNGSGCVHGTGRQRQARLSNVGSGMDSWRLDPKQYLTACDARMRTLGARGNHGDRDRGISGGRTWLLIEGERSANRASPNYFVWDVYATSNDCRSVTKLPITTPGGSQSFQHPQFEQVTLPGGTAGVVGTYFLNTQGNPSDERGELIYWWRL